MSTRTLVLPLIVCLLPGCSLFPPYREYYPNGNLKKEGRLVFGNQTGVWRFFYENGRLKAEGGYVDDVPEGEWTYRYKNGQKEMVGQFADERRTGPWMYWHANGEERARGQFDRGRETGQWAYFSREGKPIRLGDYEEGKPTLFTRFWHPGGEKKAEGYFLRGQKVGLWKYWERDGSPSEKSYPVPEGYELVRETWDDGTPRREGFLRNGEKTGRWISWHPNGERRLSGDFLDGVPTGHWLAFSGAGHPLAAGPVIGGRPRGDWTVWVDGEAWDMDPEAIRPPEITTGEWSMPSIVQERSAEDVVAVWLAEIGSATDTDDIVQLRRRASGPPPQESMERDTATKPGGTVRAQPDFTVRELKEMEKYIEYYEKGPASGYGVGSVGSSSYRPGIAAVDRPLEGNTSLSSLLVGRPLPRTVFRTPDGGAVDLKDFEGQKVLLVILRGYAGQVCVYCTTQVEAYSRSGAFDKFKQQGTKVLIAYPGSGDQLQAFLEAYANSFEGRKPPYLMVYDEDLEVCKSLGILANLAHPSTLILDSNGVVRFAYVGRSKEDRPPATKLVEELVKIR